MTSFTPAPTCFSELTDTYQIPSLSTPWNYKTSGNDIIGGPIILESACFPLAWEPNPFQYFSPGICPYGYTAGCTSTISTEFELTETGAQCCPNSWTCDTEERGPASLDWLPWIASYPCIYYPSGIFTVTSTGSGNNQTRVFTTSGISVNAFGVSIRWQATDFLITTTTTTNVPPTPSV